MTIFSGQLSTVDPFSLGLDHHLFEGKGWGLGNSHKKIPVEQKLVKNSDGDPWRKKN